MLGGSFLAQNFVNVDLAPPFHFHSELPGTWIALAPYWYNPTLGFGPYIK